MAGKKMKGPGKWMPQPALVLPEAQPAPESSPHKENSLAEDRVSASLLKVAKGPLLSNLAYSRAVEAVVSAAKGGIAKEHGSEWRDATVRLLQSRSNSPLALFWAFVAIQKCNLSGGGDFQSGSFASVDSLISVAQTLLHSLKHMTAGFCGGPTAIAAAAPIVQIVIHSIATFSRNAKDTDLSQKKQEKLWKKIQKLIFELSGFTSLCHHKDAPVMQGLFKAPSVNIGLDLWLSQTSDFLSLFPFASQLKADGFLNSIESVLHLGETVEIEVALLRLAAEILHRRFSPNCSKKDELETNLKDIVVLYAKLLGSSTVILDMLLDAPLQLGGILEDEEELHLRNVLGEMAVVGVSNSGFFDEDRNGLPAGVTVGKHCVAFLKRILIARQLASHFRSRDEYLRASDLLAGLHRRGAPPQLGEWLGDRSSLRLLISSAVLQKPQALLEWLLNASNAEFNLVLDKSFIEQPKTDHLEVVPIADMDFEQADESLFFIDTSRSYEKDAAEAAFDADEAYVMAAGDMQVVAKEDVLFDRSELVERKRARGAAKTKAAKAKQRKNSNGDKVKEIAGEDTADSEDISMSEEESVEESGMSE